MRTSRTPESFIAKAPTSRRLFAWLQLPVLALLLFSCEVPALIPEDTMNALGVQAYAEATGGYKQITGTREARWVEEIGQKIAAVSGKNYEWEFKLLDAPDTVNAFALPGGKVAVYSGLLKVTQNIDALAAVMGHEVAHATLDHGNKRMSQGLITNVIMLGASVGLSEWGDLSKDEHDGIMAALGAGAQVGVTLPYGRKQESDADIEGLRYLIRAGYDPNEAPKLWERMGALSEGKRGPAILSTHPDPTERAAKIRQMIPVIMAEEGKAPR